MTTITIEIPDNAAVDISNLVIQKGGSILNVNNDDDELSEEEVDLLKRGLKEALSIKEGKVRTVPFSDLLNEYS